MRALTTILETPLRIQRKYGRGVNVITQMVTEGEKARKEPGGRKPEKIGNL